MLLVVKLAEETLNDFDMPQPPADEPAPIFRIIQLSSLFRKSKGQTL